MNYRFADTLTERDVKHHIAHRFDVPMGCQRMRIRLHFAPHLVDDVKNMLTLTLFDPAGFRGAGHRGGNTHEVTIAPDRATPGYLAGVLPAGEWVAQIDTHMILPGAPCRYELDITLEIDAAALEPELAAPPPPRVDRVVNPKAGWYRGDLHAHTLHSDASWDVVDLVAAARAQGLDFVALTDHNTISPLTEMAQHTAADLLTLGGIELTTFWGHAVCLGSSQWIDWRVTQRSEQMADIARQVYDRGELFIIAHPLDLGDPYCTGCRWLYPALMPGPARFVEIWNGPWGGSTASRKKNEGGLSLWYDWLNAGHRLVATAGSDVHGPTLYARQPGFNVVHANELSQRGIFDALRCGHLYLSAGPQLQLAAHTASGVTATMGDTLTAVPALDAIIVRATWRDCPTSTRLRLIVDGHVQQQQSVSGAGEREWTLSPGSVRWCVLEIRADNGDILAVTNPIFLTRAA